MTVVEGQGPSKLVYDLTSPALLLCFLAPLLFLAFAQITITIGELEKPAAEAARESGEDSDKADEEVQLHPLDIAMGAPAPEKPDAKEEEESEEEGKGPSPTPAFVLAALFAALYVVGRILEPWLIKSTFRKALSPLAATSDAQPAGQAEALPPG